MIDDKFEIIDVFNNNTERTTHAIVFDEFLVLCTKDIYNIVHMLYLNQYYKIVNKFRLHDDMFPLQVKNHILFCCACDRIRIYKFDKAGDVVPVVLKGIKGVPVLFDDKLVIESENNIFFLDYDGNILYNYNVSTLTSVFETFVINDKLYCIDYNGNIYVYNGFSMVKLNQIPLSNYKGTYNDFIIFKPINSDGNQLNFYKNLSFSQMEDSCVFDFYVRIVLRFKDKLVVSGFDKTKIHSDVMIQFLSN